MKFTKEQEIFVVQQYQIDPKVPDTTVKRRFRLKFFPKNNRKLVKTRAGDFRRIYDRFLTNGIRRPQQKNATNDRAPNPTTSALVKDVFKENPRKTIEEANLELQIPKSTVF